MSQIAELRIIPTDKFEELVRNADVHVEKKLFTKKIIDNYDNYLRANSRALPDFNWSGYAFAVLLAFLEEKKGLNLTAGKYDSFADLLTQKRQNSTIIITFDHKRKYLDQLNSDISEDELLKFNMDFSETDDPTLIKAEFEAMTLLKSSLELLKDDSEALLLTIG